MFMCGMIDKHIDTDLGWFYTSNMNYDQQAPSVNQYQNNKHFPCWTQWFLKGQGDENTHQITILCFNL